MLNPEALKILDPACGSGHILVEAYDILKVIYLERGYRLRDIPKLILENNLFGLDIDDRAAQLAGFALVMKAREDDRRIFTRDIKLNVFALQSTHGLNVSELRRKLALNKDAQLGMTESIFNDAQTHRVDELDNAGFTALQCILILFEHAKTFGSLIQVPADKANFLHDLKNQFQTLTEQGDSFQKPAAVLLPLVQQAWVLAQRYDAVIANPPYMGGKGMNSELNVFAQKHFPDSKSDLFAMFMERAFDLLKDHGNNAQVNMRSWMFLSSYQTLREKPLDMHTFITMAHLGARAFGQISGEVVQTTAFVLAKNHIAHYRPTFLCLIKGNEEVKRLALLNKENAYKQIEQGDFKKIPGSLVGYASRTITRIPCDPEKVRNAYPTLEAAYQQWQTQNSETIAQMQRLEQENNRLFLDAYGLQDELEPDVPLEQITLTINPKYRYGGNLSDAELAQRFQSDTLAELISYAIGCMMGRYSLDKPGLIYAHAGNVDFDPTRYSSFPADDDGIIPLTNQPWFKDDATNRFRDFVRTVWGEAHLASNLDFVAESLCLNALKPKKSENSLETIRRYLSSQFYKDHLKTYKKRPIYLLFSSGKQKAFECLVYLHRYNESTLPRMRTEYVTPLLGKYDAFANQLKKQLEDATTSEAMLLKKELAALEKKQSELRAFDDQLKHYADRRIKLDLDEGVKVNYGKFGDLLAEVKAVTGDK